MGSEARDRRRDQPVSYVALQVDADRIVVDGFADRTSAHTYVTYQTVGPTARVRLESRIGTTGAWGNVPLHLVMLEPDGSLPRDYRYAGRFRTPELRPGEVYQVRALVEGAGPEAGALQTVMVMTRDLSHKDRVGTRPTAAA